MAENHHNHHRHLKVFVGAYGHSESESKPLVTIQNGVIGVEYGKIIFIDTDENLSNLRSKHNFGRESIYKLKNSEFLIPGFVDVHNHAAQTMNPKLGTLGRVQGQELRQCIQNLTPESEINFKDPVLAKACYMDIVQSNLNHGTTTATYYGSVHSETCEILADVAEELGQRALIGKLCVNADSVAREDFENTPECLIMTEQFVKNILGRRNPLLKPIISPKSAISCTEELLRGLGEIAQRYDIHIQTHLAETEEENSLVLDQFPQYKSCTELYEKSGLLTPKSIMAHCVHLSDDEMKVLTRNSTSIAHCSTSNILHERGLCPVRKLKSFGLKIGLGTNVTTGFSTSMLQAIRHAILTSKIIRLNNFENKPLLFDDAFYMATLGGAEVLSMEKEIGNFQVGKSFDALRINAASSKGSSLSWLNRETTRERIQKFIMLGDQINISEVYVEGKKVNHSVHKKICRFI